MIPLLAAYLLFQIFFDHWSVDTVMWKVIYFTFQYGWIAALCLYLAWKEKERVVYLLFALIWAAVAVNELTYLKSSSDTYAMMSSSPPAYALTIIAIGLFLIHEIIMRWKRR